MNKKMLFIDMQTHLYYVATHKTSYAMAQLCQNIQTTQTRLILDIYACFWKTEIFHAYNQTLISAKITIQCIPSK